MSQPVKRRQIVFDTIQATHADVVLANQKITAKTSAAGQEFICLYKDLIAGGVSIQAKVAETSQVTTLTAVGTTNSITYSIKITQYLGLALGTKTWSFVVTTPATGTISPTTIGDQFRTQINANTQIKVTASGTTTLILTADAGYPFFTCKLINLGLGLTAAATTPGVAARGLAANLTANGAVLNTAGVAFTGSAYTQMTFNYTKSLAPGNTSATNQIDGCDFWFNEAATNFADLVTNYLIADFIAAFPSGGSTFPDPEILALA